MAVWIKGRFSTKWTTRWVSSTNRHGAIGTSLSKLCGNTLRQVSPLGVQRKQMLWDIAECFFWEQLCTSAAAATPGWIAVEMCALWWDFLFSVSLLLCGKCNLKVVLHACWDCYAEPRLVFYLVFYNTKIIRIMKCCKKNHLLSMVGSTSSNQLQSLELRSH